jgi:hypothetical protein
MAVSYATVPHTQTYGPNDRALDTSVLQADEAIAYAPASQLNTAFGMR